MRLIPFIRNYFEKIFGINPNIQRRGVYIVITDQSERLWTLIPDKWIKKGWIEIRGSQKFYLSYRHPIVKQWINEQEKG